MCFLTCTSVDESGGVQREPLLLRIDVEGGVSGVDSGMLEILQVHPELVLLSPRDEKYVLKTFFNPKSTFLSIISLHFIYSIKSTGMKNLKNKCSMTLTQPVFSASVSEAVLVRLPRPVEIHRAVHSPLNDLRRRRKDLEIVRGVRKQFSRRSRTVHLPSCWLSFSAHPISQ